MNLVALCFTDEELCSLIAKTLCLGEEILQASFKLTPPPRSKAAVGGVAAFGKRQPSVSTVRIG